MALSLCVLAPVAALASDDFAPVWAVQPPLGATEIWQCVCGVFTNQDGYIIDTATGQVTVDEYFGGHGGPLPNFVFDPVHNMFGHPAYSHGYHSLLGIHPLADFEAAVDASTAELSRGLIAVAEIDSTQPRVVDEWMAVHGWWYFQQDAGRFALMHNRQLITGFAFDNIIGYNPWETWIIGNYAAARIGDDWGLIDSNGNAVIPFVFSQLMLIDERTAFADFNGNVGILDIQATIQAVASAAQMPFNLHTANGWAHEGIMASIEFGLVPPILQDTYQNNITRAEFAALAVNLYETITGNEIAGRTQFNDTSDVNVQKAGYLGVVTGIGDGNFAPNNTLTREQAAVMLARLADVIGQPLSASNPTFADNALISEWAADAVGQMQASGIMGGVGDNQFAPQGNYTREQSIITILRLFEMLD